MSLKRRYSTFASGHAGYAQLFFSLISYIVEYTDCLNYKNNFFGLTTYLAENTVCLIVKTIMGKDVRRLSLKVCYCFPILTKIGTCRQVWVKIPVEKFQTFIPMEFALIHADRQTERQTDRNAMLFAFALRTRLQGMILNSPNWDTKLLFEKFFIEIYT